jgi:ABC-type phosphonate transport system ATPase subunit
MTEIAGPDQLQSVKLNRRKVERLKVLKVLSYKLVKTRLVFLPDPRGGRDASLSARQTARHLWDHEAIMVSIHALQF